MGTRKIKPIPQSVFDPYHVYMWAGDKLSSVQKYAAAIKMYKQAEDNANENNEMVRVYDKRSRAYLHMGDMKTAESDAVEGLQLAPEHSSLLQARGDVLLEKNLFEDALATYQRGHAIKPRPPRFQHGIDAATGTVMDTLGPRAGNLMSNMRLGKIVRKMKMKQLNIAYPLPPNIEIAKRRKLRKLEKIEESYTDTYLGKAAKHYKLLRSLHETGEINLGNQKQNEKLEKILRIAVERLSHKEGSLWRRNPLYTRELDLIPKATKIFLAQKAELKKKQVQHHIISDLSAVDSFLRKKNYIDCFRRADALRHFLFEQSEKIVPFKREAINVVIRLMGEMFLSMKKILLDWDVKINDERIQYVMGIEKPYKMAHDVYRDGGFHPAIRDLDDFIRAKEADLGHSEDPLERCYLYHEAAAGYSMKGRPLIAGTYSRYGLQAAKEARDPVWLLNCLFLLARSQLQARSISEGQLTLVGLKMVAKQLKATDAYHFAERAMALASHEKPGRLVKKDFEAQKCNSIIDSMATEDLKISARQVIQKILSRPPHKRFSLAKGPRPEKRRGAGGEVVKVEREPELYVGGVLVDRRDPDQLELMEKQAETMDLFSLAAFTKEAV